MENNIIHQKVMIFKNIKVMIFKNIKVMIFKNIVEFYHKLVKDSTINVLCVYFARDDLFV